MSGEPFYFLFTEDESVRTIIMYVALIPLNGIAVSAALVVLQGVHQR